MYYIIWEDDFDHGIEEIPDKNDAEKWVNDRRELNCSVTVIKGEKLSIVEKNKRPSVDKHGARSADFVIDISLR